jgi:hypothetical protein
MPMQKNEHQAAKIVPNCEAGSMPIFAQTTESDAIERKHPNATNSIQENLIARGP